MLMKNYDFAKTVVQSNVISQKSYCKDSDDELTVKQKRLLSVIISRIKKEDQTFKQERISIDEYCRYMGLCDEYSGGSKKALEKNVTELNNKYFYVDDLKYYWVSDAEIKWDERTIILKLHDDLARFYLSLPMDKVTIYQLGYTMHFQRKYTYKVYEFSRSCLKLQLMSIQLDKAYKVFASEKYKRYSDLERKVLAPAVEEINKFSDIKVSYKPKKRKGRIKEILFYIRPQTGLDKEICDAWKGEEKESHYKQLSEAFKEEMEWEEIIKMEMDFCDTFPKGRNKEKEVIQDTNVQKQVPNTKSCVDDLDDIEDNSEDNLIYDNRIDQWREWM